MFSNLSIAGAMAWICAAMVIPGRILVGFEDYAGKTDLALRMRHYPQWLVLNFRAYHSHKYFLLSASMLAPIAVLATVLFLLFAAKCALEGAKRSCSKTTSLIRFQSWARLDSSYPSRTLSLPRC